jgi:hypothetical protein
MVLRSNAVWARACGQAILANIWRQKSLNSVVECTHPDADDGTELDTDEKLRQHYGLSVAEKRRTRRRQAT